MVEVMPLKYGSIFKKAFSDPEIFSQFASDVLGFEVKVDKVHTEYEYPEPIGFVKTKYDLFAEDVEKQIIIEIQHVKADDFFDRFLYYHIISLAEQAKGYEEYCFKQSVYTIVVLTSLPMDGSVKFSVAVSEMNPVDEFGEEVNVYPHRLIFLAARNVNEKTPEPLRSWLELITDSLDRQVEEQNYSSPFQQKVIEMLKPTQVLPEEVKDEMAWNKLLAKTENYCRAEGRAEGRTEAIKEMAIAMLKKGVDRKLIVETTGIDLETIEKFKL